VDGVPKAPAEERDFEVRESFVNKFQESFVNINKFQLSNSVSGTNYLNNIPEI
jgi:hypothetical protein